MGEILLAWFGFTGTIVTIGATADVWLVEEVLTKLSATLEARSERILQNGFTRLERHFRRFSITSTVGAILNWIRSSGEELFFLLRPYPGPDCNAGAQYKSAGNGKDSCHHLCNCYRPDNVTSGRRVSSGCSRPR
jgi:hypothetical protein